MDKPHLRPYLTRCKHCRILFITDPRNRERSDLGCPFGCQEAHRKKRSTERSTAYNRTQSGKQKKKSRNQKRRKPRAAEGNGRSSDSSPESAADLQKPAPATPANRLPEQNKTADLFNYPPEGPEEPSSNFKSAAKQSGDRLEIANMAAKPTTMDRQKPTLPKPRLDELGQTVNDTDRALQAPGTSPDLHNRAFNAGTVEYLRMVTSLIEGRGVSREEVLQMLYRIMRQHSLSRERRIDYLMRSLRERPP
jgi:hypothetical protein